MADVSKHSKKNEKLSHSFKGRLDKLGCPYTEGVDESWVLELIFKPGEPRIRLLQWLFAKFDSKLNELLDPEHAPIESKMDSRIQRLLYVSSTLGLCRYDDVDLIRGVTIGSKQTAFMDQLLDLVCIMDTSEDPREKIFQSPGIVCESSGLQDQFTSDCNYIDQLVLEEKMSTLFKTSVNLLPPDINKNIETKMVEKGLSKEKPPSPDIQKLIEQANIVSNTLDRQTLTLQELSETFTYSECDPSFLSTTSRTMQVVLSELSQLVVSFSYCYENEMRVWCNKTPPVLTDLGIAFKRVYNVLKIFVEYLTSLEGIRQSYSNLGQYVNNKSTTKTNFVHTSQLALENVHECVNILDESIQRQDIASTSMASYLST
ncbi:HAUS augmin-like complex subunit 7 [Patella vulgata]|uniref:HAUS augmin-like complex subunit 7 n=1 Tax=Patella vulgata TaxID=6465 RepID=UPI0024A9919A|nr:HAUS augmin-like complex subunit 7 [Patella vulgata]